MAQKGTAQRMGITQVFVSHAGKDVVIATALADHLRNAGHDAKIDMRDLALGHNTIEFINDSIKNAAAVIILFRSTPPRQSGRSLRSTRRFGAKWLRAAEDVSSSV